MLHASLRRLAWTAAIAIAAVPASLVTTLVLMPFWSYVERRFGIEAVGHAGPADWCFGLVYGFWLAAAGVAWLIARPRDARSAGRVGPGAVTGRERG